MLTEVTATNLDMTVLQALPQHIKQEVMENIAIVQTQTSSSAAGAPKSRHCSPAKTDRASDSIQNYFITDKNALAEDKQKVSRGLVTTDTDGVEQLCKRQKIEEDSNCSGTLEARGDWCTASMVKVSTCPKCGEDIVGSMSEHMDYHMAVQLQQALQDSPSHAQRRQSEGRTKESRHKEGGLHRNSASQNKIHTFFQRK